MVSLAARKPATSVPTVLDTTAQNAASRVQMAASKIDVSTRDSTLSWRPRSDHSRTLNETSVRMMIKLKLVRSSLNQNDMTLTREEKQQSFQVLQFLNMNF